MFCTVVIFMVKYYKFSLEDDRRRWHHDPSKRRHLFAIRNDVMSQNTWIFINIAVRISDLATRRCIAKFTRAPNLFLFLAWWTQSTLFHPTPWKAILILSSHMHAGLLSGLFSLIFSYQKLYPFLFAAYSTHLILDDMFPLLIFVEENKPCNSSVCSYLKPPLTSSTLGLNIILDLLFSTKLSLCPSLNVRPQASIP